LAPVTATTDRPRRPEPGLVAALLVWGIVLLRVIHAFGPETEINDLPYNSDAAIPVLMANDDRPFSLSSLYYYDAERFGAWAWLLPAWVHRHTGWWWTDSMLFVIQTSWVFVGVLAIGALCPRDCYAIPLIYLLVLCLQKDSRFLLFEISQVYAWIVTSLLLAWLCLRRLFRVEALRARGRHERWLVRTLLLAALLLTLWSSTSAAPYLTALLFLEAFRAWLAKPVDGGRRWVAGAAWAAGLFATALLVDKYVRGLYLEHNLRNYQQDSHWYVSIDYGFLGENLRRHLETVAAMSWFPLYVVGVLALLGLVSWCLLGFARSGRAELEARARSVLGDDGVLFALGALAIATLSFVLVVLVDHVRRNEYDPRFLTLTFQFAPVAGLTAVYLAVERGARRRWRRAGLALVSVGVAVLLLAMPDRRPAPSYQVVQRIAEELARKSPGGVLVGGYWQTYVFTSLQTRNTMTPVPVESLRTPWTIDALRGADEVVVEYLASGLDGIGSPPRRLDVYGHSLRLRNPRFHEEAGYAFALYAKSDTPLLLRDGFERGDTLGWSRSAGASRDGDPKP
jgi:hypothetical protein